MEKMLRRLCAIEGVTGALIMGKDGLPIVSLMPSDRANLHASYTSSIFESLTRYSTTLKLNTSRQVMLDTGMAFLLLAEAGEFLIVAEATRTANIGQLRLVTNHLTRELQSQKN
jgi:predicted regulator of Ras-like GTPase activity (Roadblock/LC7/MglB family)